MNTTEIIRLDGLPPSTNHGYGVTAKSGKARMYKTSEAKAWQEAVMLVTRARRCQPHQEWKDKTISIQITLEARDRRMDIDGGVKLTLDAVAKALDFNDKMVDYLSVLRLVGEGTEHTIVYVREG